MTPQQPDFLQSLERFVYAPGGPETINGVGALHRLLADFDTRGGGLGGAGESFFHLRAANVVGALLLDDRFVMSLEQFQLLCGSHFTIASLFACTPYQTADHVIAQLANVQDAANIRFDSLSTLMKCLLCYSLDSDYRFDLQSLGRDHPVIVASLVLGQLGCDLYSRPRVEAGINRLLGQSWDVFRRVTPSLPMTVTTSNAWMNCSYATTAVKHEIKRDLNAMIINGVQAQGVSLEGLSKDWSTVAKPRLLVMLEIFTSTHAMYRCFWRAIDRLKDGFEVIGIAPSNCIDETAGKLFPQLLTFDAAEVIQDVDSLIGRITALEPDMIYYPSLGMANYSLMLANLRLAPVQCFTLGHPATSMIDNMDYVIVQEQDFTTTDIYSETVILTGNDTSPTINRVREHIPSPSLRELPDCINIAVTSKHMKINHSFLACCRRIREQAERPVQFHFFPGVTGYQYEFVRHEILRILPGSEVYPTTGYDDYIRNMDRCDIRLGTFPFGGANTNMDCFGLGIPFVVLDGKQPHAHADVAQLQQAGLAETLVALDLAAYEKIALELINDDQARTAISRQMIELDRNDFFLHGDSMEHLQFDKTLLWLYSHHPQIQAATQKLWTRDDQGATAGLQ